MEFKAKSKHVNENTICGYKMVRNKTPFYEYRVVFTDGNIIAYQPWFKVIFFTMIEFDGSEYSHEIRKVRVSDDCKENNVLEVINSLKFGKFESCDDCEMMRLQEFERKIIERLDLKKRLKVLDYEIENYKPELPDKNIILY